MRDIAVSQYSTDFVQIQPKLADKDQLGLRQSVLR